ncbi:MAG: class I SAM-dependent methyltransferase [Allomuricauda sp.]
MTNEPKQKTIASFWNKESKAYDNKEGRWYLYYEYNRRNALALNEAKKWVSMLPNPYNAKLADFGCGNGANLQKLAPLFRHCYGTDISSEMVKSARQKNPDHSVFLAGVSDFNIPVDIITAVGLVEYLGSPYELFSKCNQLLPEGGVVIFTFNKSGSLLAQIEAQYRIFKRRLRPQKKQSLNKQYTLKEILLSCEANNLMPVKRIDFGFRSNLLALGPLRYVYPVIEILLDKLLFLKAARAFVSTNTLLVCKKLS